MARASEIATGRRTVSIFRREAARHGSSERSDDAAPPTAARAGQSLWLDNMTRDVLDRRHARSATSDELSVTGLTSNPIDLRQGAREAATPTTSSQRAARGGLEGEQVFFESRSRTCAGPRSLRRRPRVHSARSTAGSRSRSRRCSRTTRRQRSSRRAPAPAHRPRQPLHQDPRHAEGLPAIEESIFAGHPDQRHAALLDRDQYLAAADAYMRGLERRVADGPPPDVCSVASIFMSRWDVAVRTRSPRRCAASSASPWRQGLQGLPRAARSERMRGSMNAGARPQRLLWASTGTKDPSAPDTLYVEGCSRR